MSDPGLRVDDPHEDEAAHLAFYRAHNAAVRAFFEAEGGSHRLLEICWENGSGRAELCRFLGHEIPDTPLPHEHPAGPPPEPRRSQNLEKIRARIGEARFRAEFPDKAIRTTQGAGGATGR